MYEKRCAVIVAGAFEETSASHTRRHSADILAAIQGNPTVSRLTLCDFLIKPVQRVCRYPMLLAQLLKSPEDELQEGVVSRALKAMKDVAALVDEARRQKDIATKSKLIIERTDTAQVCHLPFTSPNGMLDPLFIGFISGVLDFAWQLPSGWLSRCPPSPRNYSTTLYPCQSQVYGCIFVFWVGFDCQSSQKQGV
jgi:hypothetical protein